MATVYTHDELYLASCMRVQKTQCHGFIANIVGMVSEHSCDGEQNAICVALGHMRNDSKHI